MIQQTSRLYQNIIFSTSRLAIENEYFIFLIHLFAAGEYNVIAVNWEKLARTPRYFYAVNNTRAVGYLTADLIEFLIEHYTNVTANNVHPVGMSLGAHVVGHLGYRLNGSLARITGLDPAGYKFHIKIHNSYK